MSGFYEMFWGVAVKWVGMVKSLLGDMFPVCSL
jgi:hypothetical protein